MASTGAKLHDVVIIAALCALEAADPGALWVRHTDGDAAHWEAALSWVSRQAGAPELFIPAGAPGHRPGEARSRQEARAIERELGASASSSDGEKERGAGRSGRSRARKA